MPSIDELWLLRLARISIRHGLLRDRPLSIARFRLAPVAAATGASFVSLHRDGRLSGCIGSIRARRSLASDVCANAWAAASADPRFAPTTAAQLARTEIEISVLQPLQELDFDDSCDLLDQLQPGHDGLMIEQAAARAVFLPLVWDSLPVPGEFLAALKRKAGLGTDDPLTEARAWKFAAQRFSDSPS